MLPGTAIQETLAGVPDFIGSNDVVTLSPGGNGKLVECLKCPQCGRSVTKGETT
jgi:hypothetical protein